MFICQIGIKGIVDRRDSGRNKVKRRREVQEYELGEDWVCGFVFWLIDVLDQEGYVVCGLELGCICKF